MDGRFNGNGQNAADRVKHICGSSLSRTDEIDDDVFHILEQGLDGAELAALPPGGDEIVES